MYMLTTEKFESFFHLEVDVIHVIRFPLLSRFETDGALANLLFFFMFFFFSASSDNRRNIPELPHSPFLSRNFPINLQQW